MPLYEGLTSTISDKLIVVIDIGAAYTKFGFTGEFAPRCIIPSEVKCKKTGKIHKIMEYTNEQDLYDLLVEFLHTLYFKYALFSPKDRSVVLVESLLCPTLFRETLAKVLFCYYEISSLLVLPSHLVSLCTLAIDSALVLDIGYMEATTIPVCHGVPAIHAWQALPLGSSVAHSNLKSSLGKASGGTEIPENVIEDVKVRCCFVTTAERAKQFTSSKSDIIPCPAVKYPLKGIDEINIPGKVRETTFEYLFEEDNDQQSVPAMILDSILKCSVDMRKVLAENILVVGGGVMVPGFKARLREELYEHLKMDKYKNKLHIDKFKFHSPPSKDNYTAWLGAAIYGCTELVSMRSLTRDVYFKEKRVPDWANMLDNQNRAL